MKSRFEWLLFILSAVGVLIMLGQMLRAWTVQQPPMLSREGLELIVWLYYVFTTVFALYVTQKWLRVAKDFLWSFKTLEK